ncbi:Lrp/AsnC family transcriptional regulator [Microbispora sp. CA-135349]|uniref:Lrp/AsnC family transcriptional regulator n=1 Tax=Microbispora sp. CA-135349 TaxID=3239953 RepID=UPI003D9359B7
MLDALDSRLLTTMRANPRIGLTELARLLGVARGTVQARLDKLIARGVIGDFGPTITTEQIGYPILAFASLQIAQGRLTEAVRWLAGIPEILEVYGTSGQGDLLCRVAARSTPHLQEIIARVLASPAVHRTDTTIALSTQIPFRIEPLLEAAVTPPAS